MNDYFDEVIGQIPIKNRLNFMVNGFERTNQISHVLFTGAKGVGKSHVARLLAKNLHMIRKRNGHRKPLVEVNGSTLKNVKTLVEDVLIPYCNGDEYTIFIDELHEINPRVAGFLLSVLNPSQNNCNTVQYNGHEITINFKQISFITATTETQKLFEPLRDRLTEVSLIDYTSDDLAKIIRLNVSNEFHCDEHALLYCSTFCRGNARSGTKMGREIETYCCANKVREFGVGDVNKLMKILDIFPNGLSRNEVKILKYIHEGEESSLRLLCSKSGLTTQAQQDIEKVLMRFGYMEIDGKRKITSDGIEYLNVIKQWEKE